MYRETHFRSLLKTISYRLWSSILTAILVWIFTRQFTLALAIGSLEVLFKMLLYFFHERLWDQIPWGRHRIKPAVIWLTGLSGAGKTTLAQALIPKLQALHLNVEHLDGDNIRQIFPHTGYDARSRDEHVRRVGYLASRLESHGTYVIVCLISPYRESRDFVRGLCQNFIEVYLDTPLEVCEARDSKGLYARARRGEIPHFTGISDPYEPPLQPELRLDGTRSVEANLTAVMQLLKQKGLI